MLKKITIGLGALLLIGAIILAFILVPAHTQIRGVSPELPTKAELEALAGNPAGPTKISYFNTATQDAGERFVGHSTFVVEWADGKILLVDLGMDAATAVEFGELFETIADADPAVPHGTVPEFLGDDLARVKGVGFTHLHVDHVQGIEPLCGSADQNIISLHTADQFAKHNLHTQEQSEMLADSECVTQQALAENARSSDQFPGIGIYPLGGHTPGSTLFAIPIDGKLWLLTGDISNARGDLIDDHGKGFIYSYLMVPEDVDRTAQLRQLFAELDKDPSITAIVSHDTRALAESGMPQWISAEEPE